MLHTLKTYYCRSPRTMKFCQNCLKMKPYPKTRQPSQYLFSTKAPSSVTGNVKRKSRINSLTIVTGIGVFAVLGYSIMEEPQRRKIRVLYGGCVRFLR